jgi:hypothetical protein
MDQVCTLSLTHVLFFSYIVFDYSSFIFLAMLVYFFKTMAPLQVPKNFVFRTQIVFKTNYPMQYHSSPIWNPPHRRKLEEHMVKKNPKILSDISKI